MASKTRKRPRRDPQVITQTHLPELDVVVDIDLTSVLLENEDFDVHAERAITGASLNRTIEGASALELQVHDPDRGLVETDLFKAGAELAVPVALTNGGTKTLHFSLAAIEKNQDTFALTFEEREVHWMRLHKEHVKSVRGAITRAEFILSLLHRVAKVEGDIPFFCPELHKTQRIASDGSPATDDSGNAQTDVRGGSEWHRVGATTDYGSDPKQTANGGMSFAELLVAGLNAGARGQDLAATLGLSNNPASAGADVGMKMGTEILIREIGGGPVYKIVKSDNGSGQRTNSGPDPHFKVDLHEGIGRKLGFGANSSGDVEVAISDGTVSSSDHAKNVARDSKYEFEVGQDAQKESFWTAAQRLAQEVQWRLFVVNGVLYFIKDDSLFLMDPLMVISEDTPGTDWIDYNLDSGHNAQQATVTCRAGAWIAPPGTVIELEDSGPADGKWLVTQVERPDLFDTATTVTLHQPQPALAEPAASSSGAGGSTGDAGTTPGSKAKITSDGTALAPTEAPEKVRQMIQAGNAIHTKGYRLGGGHGSFHDSAYDCSGAVSFVLHGADLLSSPEDSTGLESFGERGVGKWVTVYANAGHAFIVVAGIEMNTGRGGGQSFRPSGTGPRWMEKGYPTGGFVARHPKGL